MFFLNLTAAEFFSLLGVLGGLISALYLLDHARRRRVVSTLQFWTNVGAAEERQARRKMRDPWSLILQLAGLLFLLLAFSRMEWGSREHRGRDHVLLLDTSSWSGAHSAQDSSVTVLGQERSQARRYLSLLPANDRVMLITADSLADPLTGFTANRQELNDALDRVAPGFGAFDLDAALSIAHQAQSFSNGAPGEITYIGPQLVGETSSASGPDRVIPVSADRENCGILQLAVEQVEGEPNSWQALVRLKNYGQRVRTVQLQMRYSGTSFAPRRLTITPGTELAAEYVFVTRTPGELTATIDGAGSLPADDRASVFLPRSDLLQLTVYTERAAMLRPLLVANGQLSTTFFTPSQYTPHPPGADIIVLDKTAVSPSPAIPALWIDPPREHSPLPLKRTISDALLTWNTNGPLGTALHGKQPRLPSAMVFENFEGDQVIASVAEGPVVLVRSAGRNAPKSAVVGFDPAEGQLRFNVTTPLLFADLLEQLNPNAFHLQTFTAARVGLFNLPLDHGEQTSMIRIRDSRGLALPFTRRGNSLQFFVTRPSTVRVESDNRARSIDLQLPDVAERFWNPPSAAAVGLPAAIEFARPAIDLWKWLALAAAACLIAEWLLFGRARAIARALPSAVHARSNQTLDRTSELVGK